MDELNVWLETQDTTNAERTHWLPIYIKLRGIRRFQDREMMSPNMTAHTKYQDKIGGRSFMKGRLSRDCYKMKSISLACRSSFPDGEDWVKQPTPSVSSVTSHSTTSEEDLVAEKI